MIITDAARDGQITTVLTILATIVVIMFLKFADTLDRALAERDRDEAEDARMLARVAHSIDGLDEAKLHELEQWVGWIRETLPNLSRTGERFAYSDDRALRPRSLHQCKPH